MQDIENISIKQGNRIKQKGSWFVGATHSPSDISNIKRYIVEFPFYAYIMHDKDDGKGLHIHFVFSVSGSRSIKSVCDTLQVSYQDVQICRTPRGSIRYLIHADDTEKFQYNRDSIVSNNSDRVEYYFNSINSSILSIYSDYSAVKCGKISSVEFFEKYQHEFATMPFYQKIKTMEAIDKMIH